MPKYPYKNVQPCVCGKQAKCRGYCSSCYNKLLLTGKFDDSLYKCSVKNCDGRVKGKTENSIPLCNKHFSKWYRGNKLPEGYDKKRYLLRKNKIKETKTRLKKSNSGRYTSGKSQAKNKNIPWVISKEWFFKHLIKNQCFYCEGKLNNGGYCLDRVDSTKGYTEENCVSCCWNCNNLKGDYLSQEETLKVVRLLKDLRGKTNIWE